MIRTSNTVTMPLDTMEKLLEKHGGPTLPFFKAAKRWFRAQGFLYPKPPTNKDNEAPDLLVWLDKQGWHHDVTE